uniref:nitrite reductase (cytochrome; ammonia-forming) n=1 Tax=Bellilinea caldifistulae TaxID=360411 RepID=A0A7C4L0N4_9CHLR
MLKNPKTIPIVLSIIIVILAGTLVALLIFMKNQPLQTRGVPNLIEIAAMEPDSSVWGINFPNQYTTFLRTETNNARTPYGGSDPVQKLDVDPRLRTLFAGMAFSKDYKEDRGHRWSLTDVRETGRVNEKTPGTCYSCKSANTPMLWAEMGAAEFARTPFMELGKQIDQPIGCANCHEAGTMRLIVTNPALEAALQAQGKDWRTFTRQEMRTVVCANCHVEYYFAGEGKLLVFPWSKGTSIEKIEEFYNEIGFSDWTHAESGASMIKMQHPEYELYSAGSTHFNAGVSCADCHMPYTRDGAVKFSTHNVHSPLLNPAASCGTCHTNVDYVVGRVTAIQNQVWVTMSASEDALVEAIAAIKTAAETAGADPQLIEEARALHRAAQLRWDFIAAENSMGFHNPEEALRILAAATDLARQAQLKAVQAVSAPQSASR